MTCRWSTVAEAELSKCLPDGSGPKSSCKKACQCNSLDEAAPSAPSVVHLITQLRPPHLQGLSPTDLKLLHHAQGSLALTSTSTEDLRLGVSYPYVLHGILAVTALKLFACQHPAQSAGQRLLEYASRHQQHALTLANPHIGNLDERNVQPVLKLAFMIALSSLGFPLCQDLGGVVGSGQTNSDDSIDHVLLSFRLTRGFKSISQRKWQLESVPAQYGSPNLEDPDPWQQDLVNRYSPHYSTIRKLITSRCTPGYETSACLDAIRKVFSFVALIEDMPDLWQDARLIQIWPIELEEIVITMMSARREIALVILGHYTALLELRSGVVWPFRGWPKVLLEKICMVLGSEWATHLTWPRARVLHHLDGSRTLYQQMDDVLDI